MVIMIYRCNNHAKYIVLYEHYMLHIFLIECWLKT